MILIASFFIGIPALLFWLVMQGVGEVNRATGKFDIGVVFDAILTVLCLPALLYLSWAHWRETGEWQAFDITGTPEDKP